MVQKIQTSLVDDYDGGEATETVTFGLDGATYEIDLSNKNAQSLRDTVRHYVERARKTGGRKPAGTRDGRPSLDPGEAKTIRGWAQAQGHPTLNEGRLPVAIVEAYDQAHRMRPGWRNREVSGHAAGGKRRRHDRAQSQA